MFLDMVAKTCLNSKESEVSKVAQLIDTKEVRCIITFIAMKINFFGPSAGGDPIKPAPSVSRSVCQSFSLPLSSFALGDAKPKFVLLKIIVELYREIDLKTLNL